MLSNRLKLVELNQKLLVNGNKRKEDYFQYFRLFKLIKRIKLIVKIRK